VSQASGAACRWWAGASSHHDEGVLDLMDKRDCVALAVSRFCGAAELDWPGTRLPAWLHHLDLPSIPTGDVAPAFSEFSFGVEMALEGYQSGSPAVYW